MSEWSRRQFLATASLPLLGGVAGCGGLPDRRRQRVDPGGSSSRSVADYETTKVRNDEGAPLVVSGAAAERVRVHDHVTDREGLPTFSETAEGRELARFADATDFETESLLLHVRPVPECYDLRLVSVSRDDDGVSSDYCRDTLPADVGCDADAEDTVGIGIRLPFPGDDLDGLGMGYSRSCGSRPTAVDFEPVTPSSNATADSETGGASK